MQSLTFDQINNAEFCLYGGNPVIKHFGVSTVAADPSVLTPDKSHDGKWHLFCHTLAGVFCFDSADGIAFFNKGKVVGRAMRPNINYIDGKYYLYFERIPPKLSAAMGLFFKRWHSEIYCMVSDDLGNWTKPFGVLKQTLPYELDGGCGVSMSNPFLVRMENENRLYYSCGLTYLNDCKFSEPTNISFASSEELVAGYVKREKPIITPDKDSPYLNLCCGCIKVYRLKDCFIALQNGIYKEGNDSKSAIMLLKSEDGITFTHVKTLLAPDKNHPWMAQYVYACDLTYYNGRLNLYFNARDVANPLKGRESIGIFTAEVK